MSKKVASVLFISVATLATMSGCTKKAEVTGKSFVFCSEGSPSSFNPQIVTDGPSYDASSRNVFNRLVEFERGKTTIIPALAESWEISPDGLKYTFHLRKNVKWHTTENFTPTRLFNADDVLFTFNRQRLADHPYHNVGGGTYEYFDSMEMGKIIKDIVKVDDHTVRFELSHPEAPFLADLAMDFASILSQEYGDKMMQVKTPDTFDTIPVGTGPFIFVRYIKDTSIRYKMNPDYFLGRAPLDQVVFLITPDPSVRYQKLKTGECHLIAYPSPADLEAMRANSEIVVAEEAGLNVGYLTINVLKPPFDKLEVRQAINHAMNKASYVNAIYLGNGMVAKNPIPPTMWSYNDDVQDYDYNPEKAKELLKKAGYPNGFETDLWVLPISRPYNPNGKKMGEMMQSDLAQVGIKVKLVNYDWPTYLAKSKAGEHALAQFGWNGDNGDPDNFLNALLSCGAKAAGANRSFWCFKSFDELMRKAKITSKQEERAGFYKQAQVIFHDQAPWVPIAHSKVQRAMTKKVKGFVMDPFGGQPMYGLDLND